MFLNTWIFKISKQEKSWTANLIDLWWLLQALGQRDPSGYPLMVWVSQRRTCPFVVSINSKFVEIWRLQFQVKQLYFPQNKLHVKLTSSDAILLLPDEFLCACKARTVQTAQCTLYSLYSLHLWCHWACWVGSFCSVAALSIGWDIPQDKTETSFLSARYGDKSCNIPQSKSCI